MAYIQHASETGYGAWSMIAGAQWTLGTVATGDDIEFLSQIQAKLTAHGDARVSSLAVAASNDDRAWRLNYDHAMNRVEEIDDMVVPVDVLGSAKATMLDGVTEDEFETELADLEAFFAENHWPAPKVLGWMAHAHDRESVRKLKARGYLGCRDGLGTSGGEGNSAWIHGSSANIQWWKGWEMGVPYGMTLFSDMTAATIQALLNQAAVDGHLAGAARLPKWKTNNSLVNFYCHGTPASGKEIDANHVVWMMQYLKNDGDVWITTVKEALEWFHDRHEIGTDELVYVPKAGHSAADYGGKPWNGHSCCFCFSTDDGYDDNLLDYLPVFQGLNLPFTAFITKGYIGISAAHMSLAELHEFYNSGLVDLQSHGSAASPHTGNHPEMVSNEGLQITTTDHRPVYVRIYDNAGTQTMEVWGRADHTGAGTLT